MNMKKLASLLLAMVLVLAMAVPAMAQTVDSGKGGSATITIANASKGETYSVVKIFEASVTGTENGSIVYTGDIPEGLESVFTKNDAGYIVVAEGKNAADVTTTVSEWAKNQTATASATSDGSALTFTGLQYGYYAVITTQGALVTIDSTNPNATVYDKNTTTPGITKKVNDADVDIGQTVTYTATATTTNYIGSGEDAEIVTSYEISDTLPEFLTDVTVTSIIVDEDADLETTDDQKVLTVEQFGEDKKIEIEWATFDEESKTYTSKYANGSLIVVTYTAKVTNSAVIDGAGNKNTVTLQPMVDTNNDGTDEPTKDKYTDDEIIYTYAGALQKVDENKKPLAGAKFAALGLDVEKVSNGVYRVVSYDPTSTEYGTEMETDAEGQLVILGLSTGSVLTVKETVAPAGYNKLVDTTTITPVKTGEEIKATEQTIYYDANGKVTDTVTETTYTKTTYNVDLLKTAIVVVNQAGTELPSTGGMGTTMLYVGGGILVLGAVILLITRKRMTAK